MELENLVVEGKEIRVRRWRIIETTDFPGVFLCCASMLYGSLKNSVKAMIRDMNNLLDLGAIKLDRVEQRRVRFSVRLEWPSEITETEFFEKIRKLPKAKSHSFLQLD